MIQYLYICVASDHHKCLVNIHSYKLFYYRTFKVYYLVTFKKTIYIIGHHVACYISRTQLYNWKFVPLTPHPFWLTSGNHQSVLSIYELEFLNLFIFLIER